MRKSEERIEHHDCPDEVKVKLLIAGGTNCWGEPNFRIVWGYNRIVKVHGQWETWRPPQPTGLLGLDGRPILTEPRCVECVVETREIPKYLPGNCWHLERWCPPSDYGTPETWGKLGEEVHGSMTIDTAGPYPSRGEWELVFPLTSDGTPQGMPIPLESSCVEAMVRMLQRSREFTIPQRKAAIEQRMAREDRQSTERMVEALSANLPAFYGREFVTKGDANG